MLDLYLLFLGTTLLLFNKMINQACITNKKPAFVTYTHLGENEVK